MGRVCGCSWDRVGRELVGVAGMGVVGVWRDLVGVTGMVAVGGERMELSRGIELMG